MMKHCDAEGLRNRMDLAHSRACEKCVFEGGWVAGGVERAGWCGTRKTVVLAASWRRSRFFYGRSMQNLTNAMHQTSPAFLFAEGFLSFFFCLVLFSSSFFSVTALFFSPHFTTPLLLPLPERDERAGRSCVCGSLIAARTGVRRGTVLGVHRLCLVCRQQRRRGGVCLGDRCAVQAEVCRRHVTGCQLGERLLAWRRDL